jgi:hypothetical protein
MQCLEIDNNIEDKEDKAAVGDIEETVEILTLSLVDEVTTSFKFIELIQNASLGDKYCTLSIDTCYHLINPPSKPISRIEPGSDS